MKEQYMWGWMVVAGRTIVEWTTGIEVVLRPRDWIHRVVAAYELRHGSVTAGWIGEGYGQEAASI